MCLCVFHCVCYEFHFDSPSVCPPFCVCFCVKTMQNSNVSKKTFHGEEEEEKGEDTFVKRCYTEGRTKG